MAECFDRNQEHTHTHTVNTVGSFKATGSDNKHIAREGRGTSHEHADARCIDRNDTEDENRSSFDPRGFPSLLLKHSASPPRTQHTITGIIIKTLNKITGASRGSLFGHVVSMKLCV